MHNRTSTAGIPTPPQAAGQVAAGDPPKLVVADTPSCKGSVRVAYWGGFPLPKMGDAHPIFAAVWSRTHKQVDRFRPQAVAPAHGHVLEVGAGGGENLRFYELGDRVQRLTLTEPDPYMRQRAESNVRRMGLAAEVVAAAAEALPFASGSFDSVVATLVFCSVEDQPAALAEVRRVLKPGGSFLFLEHVRSAHPVWSRFQDVATPVNRVLGAGCRLNRDTIGAIKTAGFEVVRLSRVMPQFPMYAGAAVVR